MTEDGRDDMDNMFCGLVDRTKDIMLNLKRGHCMRLPLSKTLDIEEKRFNTVQNMNS